ncbi:MAG: filamentous hemagglutinin N-terminal domain-containing protein [Nitrospira sp.]|nr:filamentous hemagglutinin N-terminal domain-containing protein [Nitrospira sp.]
MTRTRMIASLIVFAYLAQLVVVPILLANPMGPAVVGGEATVSGLGTSEVTIAQASQQAIINWQQFNIAQNEMTQFIQPNAEAIALNRIFDQSPSEIFGSLRANGSVILLNRNGILFGPNAQVNVGGLIAASLNLTNANFLAGHYLFQGTGVEGLVKNMGVINGSQGIYLLAPNVENSGVIASPGGNIVLAAGAKAFLSHRPDGRGFLAELSNPLGQAVNMKDLIADGGTITVAGRVVNQAGVIKADSVREQNGKIELLASEAVTLRDGSRTLARGDLNGVSNGGTILAIADLKSGTADFQKGALIDMSGGRQGGHGGFAEISAASVSLRGQFMGTALGGYKGGRVLIDPIDPICVTISPCTTSTVDLSEFALFESKGLSAITFQSPAGSDLVVTGQYDLGAGWTLSGTPGILTFLAGGNLIFDNAFLTNNTSNTRWDYVGTAATGDVRFNNSFLATGFGGNLTLTAAAPGGNINLVDAFGNLSVLKTSEAGGNITLTAGHDVISPSADISFGLLGGSIFPNILGGIRLDGPGNLTIIAGNDVRGGLMQGGVLTGPGFVLTNGTAYVTAGRHIGAPKLAGADATAPDEYANLTLGTGTISLTAQTGNIYLGRVQDKGITDTLTSETITVDPSNKVVLQAAQDIFLNPRKVGSFEAARTVSATYPASFHARTTTGSIFVGEESLTFWPSTTGAITFSAGKDLIGLQRLDTVPDVNYDYIFIGFPNVPGGHWQLVNLKEAMKDPALAPFVSTFTLDAFNGIRKPDNNNGGRTVTVLTNPPNITMLQTDPTLINNQPFDGTGFNSTYLKNTATNVPPHSVQDVVFEARSGDIETLVLNLQSVPFRKRVTIDAANNIEAVTAKIGVPEGVEARVHAGNSLNMRTAGTLGVSGASDLTFSGIGTARVVVGGLLDLATSTGINFRFLPDPSLDVNKGGFLDLSVGGSIKMDSSLIASYNGASISIHGPGAVPILDINGNISVDNGKPVAVTGQVAQVGGRSVIQVNGKTLEFKNETVVLDGAQTLADLVNPVTVHLSMVEQGGALLAKDGQPYQVLRAEVPLDAAKTLTGFDPVLVNGQLVLVAPDGSVLLAPAGQTAKTQSLPGSVAVGSNVSFNPNTTGAPLGITTLGGGAIDVLAKGDINVEKSRISTFQGGDITLISTNGNINAGSGSRNETVDQVIEQDIDGQKVTFTIRVPASGISTFHPDDPRPLKFIEFNDPEITALKNQASRETFFGRTASAEALLKKANELQAQRQPIFNETQLKPYINSLNLGDVNLAAETGAVVIPSAGIQGRTVQIFAPRVDNQGGQIIGNVIIPPTVNVSGPPLSITGTGAGAVATPITPVSGSTATASVSSTTAAVSTSAKSSDSVQETAAGVASEKTRSQQVASKKNDEKDGKGQLAKSVRVKRGVVIQVDVKPAS